MSKIRLAFYMYTPEIGGAERHLRDLLWSLSRDRYEITLFYEPWPEFEQFLGLDTCPQLRRCPVAVHEIDRQLRKLGGKHTPGAPLRGNWLSRTARYWTIASGLLTRYGWTIPNYTRLKSAFSSVPIDILHIDNGGYPGAWTAQWASIAAKSIGIPTCIMTIANTPLAPRFPVFIERKVDQRVASAVDTFAVVANEVGSVLEQKHGFPPQKMVTIYYGVEPPPNNLTESDRASICRQFGLSPGSRAIGMVARLDPVKGHGYFLQALARLREDFVGEVEGVVIGGGHLLDDIKRRAVEMGLEGMVKFTGPLPRADVQRAMSVCDIVTLPSEIEGLPYAIIEAMSLGKPVVGTSVGGIPEQILDGETGLIVPPRDPAALASALARLLGRPEEIRRMGEAAHRRFLSHFSLDKMLQAHDELYQRLYLAQGKDNRPQFRRKELST